jgi:hypothetical protein
MEQEVFQFENGHEDETYRAKALAWIEEHPQVFALFERFALQMVERNRRFGIGQLAERVRWEVAMTWTKDMDGFRINNNHRAYLARELINRHPKIADFIELRRLRSED